MDSLSYKVIDQQRGGLRAKDNTAYRKDAVRVRNDQRDSEKFCSIFWWSISRATDQFERLVIATVK